MSNNTLQRYAQLSSADVHGLRTVVQVIESDFDPDGVNGEWVACGEAGPGWTTADDGQTYTPPAPPVLQTPKRATKRAFQTRFPKLANGISTKWDAMCMFQTDDSYAASLGVTGQALLDLRMLVTTGIQRLSVSPFVDMSTTGEAAGLTALLMQPSIPSVFRLSAAERDALLNTPLTEGERYVG